METQKNQAGAGNGSGLYPYQREAISTLFGKIEQWGAGLRLLYQLPTGGGKTMIFSEIVRQYISRYSGRAVVLTHRIELCGQTSATLRRLGIKNKIINSAVKRLDKNDTYACYVAMVETIKNRLRDGLIDARKIGLVIIDEAHHNSFAKLLNQFKNATVIGVTATPLSSDVNLPMRKNYSELVVGEGVAGLIDQGFLARPITWRYDVELNTLKTGQHGDFTVSTSDDLYSSPAMLELLLQAYEAHAKNKKTLIFNNGIFTSRNVLQMFADAGYPARHLDNHTPPAERAATLKWFKRTKGAILTSVSILTTGFDEPTVQAVILNRATTSLTLFHQMIGRGSRRMPGKKTFTIIDLGNNTDRFGNWHGELDWQQVFTNPEAFYAASHTQTASLHNLPSELRSKFPNSTHLAFDVQQAFKNAVDNRQKVKTVMRDSLRQHALMCIENSSSITEAMSLVPELEKEIDWRVKQYAKCLGTVTKNYTEWLQADYKARLGEMIRKLMSRRLPVLKVG